MFKTRRQSLVYRSALAWLSQLSSQGYRFLRVDLTSAPESCANSLLRHLEELRRRIKREFGFDIEMLKIRTNEGNGLLHCVFACKNRSFFIPSSWLSDQWQKIHRAPIVKIKKMTASKESFKRVAGYFASHGNENHPGKIIRCSWTQKALKFPIRSTFKRLYRAVYDNARSLNFRDLLLAWESLLYNSKCRLGGLGFEIMNRRLELVSGSPQRERRLIMRPLNNTA